ncbi:type I 3-dehydroquinate dehydratase [Actinosynnema sp. NPDC023658]|uniref:type I 3-dehydroquinate dehydratase n=1 Tax=Actinosynnema sp. NPDC023658 TaxID=3155465 RepID=UPI0033C5EFFC
MTLRALLDSGIPLVAVSFADDDVDRAAEEARSAGVDVAELRIDRFSRTDVGHVREQVRAFGGLPVLATVRSAFEGGGWKGSEAERLEVFRAVAPLVDAVDVELSSRELLADVITAARAHDTLVIVSYHNFDRTPGQDELTAIVRDAKAAGADVVKISTMATSSADVKVLASLLVNADDDTELIVIAMGAIGTASRIFFPALGSKVTYTFIGHQPTSGQLGFAETFRLMRRFYPEYDRRKTAVDA